FKATYLLRVRYLDSLGAWSEWAERLFITRTQLQIPIWSVRSLLAQPAPDWHADGGDAVTLPAGVRAILEAGSGVPLLTLIGGDSRQMVPGQELTTPEHVRLRVVTAEGTTVTLPSSKLAVVSSE